MSKVSRKRLSIAEQRNLIRQLPPSRLQAVKRSCVADEQKGEGIKTIATNAGKALGHLGRELGPTVLKELIIPMLKKKIAGSGKKRMRAGRGLRLAGTGKRKPKAKKSRRKM